MILYYPLLDHAYHYCTILSSTGPLPISMVHTSFYWFPAYPLGTLLSSADPLPIPTLLNYRLLAPCLSLSYFLLTHCLYLWYSTTFYWLPAYPHGSLLPSTGPLPIPMVLFYLLLTHCLYLSPTGSLRIPMILYYLLLAPC